MSLGYGVSFSITNNSETKICFEEKKMLRTSPFLKSSEAKPRHTLVSGAVVWTNSLAGVS